MSFENIEIPQEYFVGDLVEVVYLPDYMSHFDKGIGVIGKVNHNECQQGNEWEWGYTVVWVKNQIECAWYHNLNLKLLKGGHMRDAVNKCDDLSDYIDIVLSNYDDMPK